MQKKRFMVDEEKYSNANNEKKTCVNQFHLFLLVQQFIYSSFMIYNFVQKEGYCIIYDLITNLPLKEVYLKPWVA